MVNALHALAATAWLLAGSAGPPALLELTVGLEDRRGRPPLEVSPEHIAVVRDGEEVPVLAMEPLAGDGLRRWRRGRGTPPLAIPWSLVVYLDPVLTERASFLRAARELSAQAATLTALGSVEVVVAAPEPVRRLGATRDPKLVAAVLEEVVRERPDAGELARLRRRHRQGLLSNRGAGPDALARFARAAAEAEGRLIEDRLERVLRWLGGTPRPGPKALLWPTDGFDLAPRHFYAQAVSRDDHRRAVEETLGEAGSAAAVSRFADALARGGWTVAPVWTADRTRGGGRTFLDPEAPLRLAAEITGGPPPSRSLEEALLDLGRAWRLALPARAAAGAAGARLQVRARAPGLEVRAPRLLPSGAGAMPAELPSLLRTGPARVDLGDLGVPAPTPVYLLPPTGELVTGRTAFRAQATRPEVAAVAFRIDGRTVATDREPPFEAVVDLPEIPRTATLRAVALDETGAGLGADTVELNPHRGALSLAIREPEAIPSPGAYTVRLDVRAPAGAGLATVDLFWNEDLVATFTHPPYEHVLTIPPGAGSGYLRALATLPGGGSAEAALALGESGFAGRVDVDLVELPVTVKDSRGRPVADVDEGELTVLEDEIEQAIREVRSAADTPLTVCLAIDLSTSLRDDMPLVKDAATRFVSQVLRPRDRGLVVGFADRPYLIRGPTRDHAALAGAIADLPSLPNTALSDAVMVSLYHLRGAAGRKAVVLLTDGSDNQSRHSSHQAFEFARRTGIPIYVIGIGTAFGAEWTGNRGWMESLAATTGASFHQVYGPGRIEAAYEEIGAELRSQYLVSYQSTQGTGKTGWRAVEVRVARRGLRARTIAGYFKE